MTNGERDELDRALDAALAKYAAAEPRAGLEERVLANLRAERSRTLGRAWWRWSAMAAVAAIVIVTVTLAWRSERTSPKVATHPAFTNGGQTRATTQVATTGVRKRAHRRAAGTMQRTAALHAESSEMAGNPKLEQFPAPRPLSEQEELLQAYIARYPEQAVLVAKARTEELRQEQLEEINGFPAGDRNTDSEEPNNGRTDR